MPNVIIKRNPFKDSEYDHIVTSNPLKFIYDYFKCNSTWSNLNRLFINDMKSETEVDPSTRGGLRRIAAMGNDDTLICLIYPSFAVAGVLALGVVGAIGLRSDPAVGDPNFVDPNAEEIESPNNSLNERTNTFRLNERVPDIYGSVLSIPDLLNAHYYLHEGPQGGIQGGPPQGDYPFSGSLDRVEYGFYCVGKGYYDILELKDGETLLSEIQGASAEIYDPNTSPNSGIPSQLIGEVITEPLRTFVKIEAVASQNITPYPPFQQAEATDVGPFIVPVADAYYLNFESKGAINRIEYSVLIQRVDGNGEPIGNIHTTNDALLYWPFPYNPILTTKINNPFPNATRLQVTVRRTSAYQMETVFVDGIPVIQDITDEFLWLELYAVSDVDQSHFGDVTTIYTRTLANSVSQELEERQLNCRANRKLRLFNQIGSTDVFERQDFYTHTTNFRDIALDVCLDDRIGRRSEADLDIVNFFATEVAVRNYFGNNKVVQFNYTFDDSDNSFEEILTTICNVAFCSAFRRGRVISLFFERSQDTSSLLFNHRNKIPRTENRSVFFGTFNDFNGVELEYIKDEDSSAVFYYVPEDRSASNPEKFKMIGVTNKLQAYFHAYRRIGIINNRKINCEFDCTQEANLLNIRERILVADGIGTETYDGQIESKSGLILTLSQPFFFVDGTTYSIWLQLANGTVQSIPITAGATAMEVVLANQPNETLSTDNEHYAKSVYQITESSNFNKLPFLIETKEPQENFSISLNCYNYSDAYYEHDRDFRDGIVDISGEIIPVIGG